MVADLAMSADRMREGFLRLLPKIETHARIFFRHVACRDTKADRIAEAVALGWKWYRRLVDRGKDATAFPTAFASLLAKAVNSGRGLCGQTKARDVLSPIVQRRHRFRVTALPSSTATAHERLYSDVRGQQKLDEFEERLSDNTITPVIDQVIFRVDFAAWLNTLASRDRRLVEELMKSERTIDLSLKFHVTPGRISQLRRRFERDWEAYCGERPASSKG